MTGTPTEPIEQENAMLQEIEKPDPMLSLTKQVVAQVACELQQPHDAQGQPVGEPQVGLTFYSGLPMPGPDGKPTVAPLIAHQVSLDLAVWDNLVEQLADGKVKLRAQLSGLSLPASMGEAEVVAQRAAQAETLRSS